MTQLTQDKLVKKLMFNLDKIDTQNKLIEERGDIFNCDERLINVLDMYIRDFESLYYSEAWKLDDIHLAQVQKRYYGE